MTLQRLNEHLELRMRLARAQEMLEALRSAVLPGATTLTGMPHAPGVKDKVGDLATEIADMDARIKHLEAEIRQDEKEILSYICNINDDQTRLIFRLRFIRCLTWGEVASVIGGRNTEDAVKSVCYRYLSAKVATA